MYPVVIHKYTQSLSAIEFGTPKEKPSNFLVFIGGLGDGFLTVPYVPKLAEALTHRYSGEWVVVQALISSSYLGFGMGSLKRDTEELATLVKYLRSERGTKASKVILMGHSTGSQDTLEYLTQLSKSECFDPISEIDAGILQAPVSDREGFGDGFDEDHKLRDLMAKAQKDINEGNPHEIMPASSLKYTFGAPATAYRFHSLFSQRGDDDYFSSYLSSSDFNKSFKLVSKPLLVLYSGNDEFVSQTIDKQELIDRWRAACDPKYWSRYSKVVKGATHNVGEKSENGAVDDLIKTVLSFIDREF